MLEMSHPNDNIYAHRSSDDKVCSQTGETVIGRDEDPVTSAHSHLAKEPSTYFEGEHVAQVRVIDHHSQWQLCRKHFNAVLTYSNAVSLGTQVCICQSEIAKE